MKKTEESFGKFLGFNTYTLFDATHPLEFYIGIDEKGRKTLFIRSESKPDAIKKTNAIDISVSSPRINLYQLGFHLNDDSMSGIFYKFCDDIIESTRVISEKANGIHHVVRRYNAWKKLFYKLNKDIMSESQILGLIGELTFIRKFLLKIFSPIEAINSWSGCDKTHKDFSIGKIWYEVKATNSSSLTVQISSIEQLDSDSEGFLVVFEFEKMSSSFKGITLNSVINDVLSQLSDEETDLVLEKLRMIGYEYNEEYDKYCYREISKKMYCVNNGFPRISKNDINTSIVEVKYEILKKDLLEFLAKDKTWN